VEVVRGPRDERPGTRLFGPYHSATAARATLRVLNRHFQLRTCRDAVIDNRTRPCLQFQIGRCPAPCVYDVSSYPDSLSDAALFLSGRKTELADRLHERMVVAAEKEEFEVAARLRDQWKSIGAALDDQAVSDVEGRKNQDIWGVDRKGALLVLARVVVRDGKMQGMETWDFDRAEFPTEELVASWLAQVYDEVDQASIPDEVLLSEPLGDAGAGLADVVSERRGRRVEVRTPQRGKGGKLVEIAQKNATTTMLEKLRKQETRESGLRTLQ
jgi:excinuclease ABC subunit C